MTSADNDLAVAALPVELLELRAELAQVKSRLAWLEQTAEVTELDRARRWLRSYRARQWHTIAELAEHACSVEFSGRNLAGLGHWAEIQNMTWRIRAALKMLEEELLEDKGDPE